MIEKRYLVVVSEARKMRRIELVGTSAVNALEQAFPPFAAAADKSVSVIDDPAQVACMPGDAALALADNAGWQCPNDHHTFARAYRVA